MSQLLSGKVSIITGGGSGIGQAISRAFANAGSKVAIFDFDTEGGEKTAAAIRDSGQEARFYHCNVADLASVRSAVDAALSATGRIDILVNNAGIAHIGTAVSTTPEDFDRIMNVNVKGVYHCLHTILPHMLENKSGVILNMSSVASIAGLPDRFAYSASKGAVHTMTFSVAADYIKQGIRCNCVCPARVHTPFVDGYLERNYPDNKEEMFSKLSAAQPIGRMAQPSEVAELALYLCSDAASFITGQAFPLDGGYLRLR